MTPLIARLNKGILNLTREDFDWIRNKVESAIRRHPQTGTKFETDDVVNELYASLSRNLKTFNSLREFEYYLYKCVINKTIDSHRKPLNLLQEPNNIADHRQRTDSNFKDDSWYQRFDKFEKKVIDLKWQRYTHDEIARHLETTKFKIDNTWRKIKTKSQKN